MRTQLLLPNNTTAGGVVPGTSTAIEWVIFTGKNPYWSTGIIFVIHILVKDKEIGFIYFTFYSQLTIAPKHRFKQNLHRLKSIHQS